MTILKSVPVYFTKLDPRRPIVLMEDADKPASDVKLDGMERAGATVKELEEAKAGKVTGWEVVCRTSDKAQATAWKAEIGSKNVRAIREDREDEESAILYWQMKLKRKQFKANGEYADVPEVKRGDTLEDLDPTIIGNGSIADIRIYQYPYSFTQNGKLIEGDASVLMGIKLSKLIKYEAKPREEFDKGGFEVVDDEGNSPEDKSWDEDENEVPDDDLEDEIPF